MFFKVNLMHLFYMSILIFSLKIKINHKENNQIRPLMFSVVKYLIHKN